MNVIEALKTTTNYPTPIAVLQRIAMERGIDPNQEMTAEKFKEPAYRLADADVMEWTSKAPNFSEGGVSVSFTESEKKELHNKAQLIYRELGEAANNTNFGYLGDSL